MWHRRAKGDAVNTRRAADPICNPRKGNRLADEG